jgi:hypothetical protein
MRACSGVTLLRRCFLVAPPLLRHCLAHKSADTLCAAVASPLYRGCIVVASSLPRRCLVVASSLPRCCLVVASLLPRCCLVVASLLPPHWPALASPPSPLRLETSAHISRRDAALECLQPSHSAQTVCVGQKRRCARIDASLYRRRKLNEHSTQAQRATGAGTIAGGWVSVGTP